MGSKNNTKLETFGNENTMNLNPIVHQNILASPYFKSLYEKKTYHQIIDEIYNEVSDLDTTVSTAFCLLYKLWTIRLTIKQIEGLVDHVDSAYIRGIGFLYLRHVCKPQNLWDWFSYYLDDEDELSIQKGPNPPVMTIGKLCRMLLSPNLNYINTILPRIPVPVQRDLDAKILEHDRIKKASAAPPAIAGSMRPPPSFSRDFPERDRRIRSRSPGPSYSRRQETSSRGHEYRRRSRTRSRSPRDRRDKEYGRRERERRDYDREYDRRRRHDDRVYDREAGGGRRKSRSKSADEGDEYDRYERDRKRYEEKYSKEDRERKRSRTRSRSRERGGRR